MRDYSSNTTLSGDFYFDDRDDPICGSDEIEAARASILNAYAEFYGVLKAEATVLPVADHDRKWIDPDQNGLEDILTNILSALDQAVADEWSNR